MTQQNFSRPIVLGLTLTAAMCALPAFAQVDEAAAKALFKQNECTKCHAAEKTKKGPSLKKTAAKYREKKQDENQVVKHMTEAKKVKLEDGTQEDHKIPDTKDPKELANLARWILSH